MRRVIVTILFFVLVAALHVGFFSVFPALRSSLNFFLVMTIAIAIHLSPRTALWWAFAAGICLDLVSSEPFGLRSITLILVVWMLDECYRRMFSHRHGISLVVLYAIGVVADVLLRWGIWQIIRLIGFDVSEWFPDAWLSWFIGFFFWNIIAVLFASFFLERWFAPSDRSSITIH